MRNERPRQSSKTFDLGDRTKEFALRAIRLYRALPTSGEAGVIARQLLRSATSVGANYRAARRARSRSEFRAKMGIVEEEVDETLYWMELLVESGIVNRERLEGLMQEANELAAIMVASIKTSKAGRG